jgi:hypothetical protein
MPAFQCSDYGLDVFENNLNKERKRERERERERERQSPTITTVSK